MGGIFSDMVGIESASENLANALLEAEANATLELRNVTLTAINYIKSFTPAISLLLVFLILLLLVGILSILNRMLHDLKVSPIIRGRILIVVSIVLYIWFVGVQVAAAVKQKSLTLIIIAVVACLGLVAIMGLCIWLLCCTSKKVQPSSDSSREMQDNPPKNQRKRRINDSASRQTDNDV